jgi:ankyrin repeat protein
MVTPHNRLIVGVQRSDADAVRQLLADHPNLNATLDQGSDDLGFGATPLIAAVQRGNRALIEVLLAAGAGINVRSAWWAGGFSVLDSASDELAPWLIQRGATLDAGAAAKFGMLPELTALVAADPTAVHRRGGDGKTPLHWARDVATATLLLNHGADINARDVDHESTAAQYAVRERTEVARYLVSVGAEADLFLAAAVGDLALVQRLVAENPRALEMTIPDDFPMQNPRAGGTIYIWTLGQGMSPHLVAKEFGHPRVFDWLMEQSGPDLRLTQACMAGDAAAFDRARGSGDPIVQLSPSLYPKLVDAAVQNSADAVRLFLRAGAPVDTIGRHAATALHWAAWQGNVEMADELLRHHASLTIREGTYHGTPLDWALHGSVNGWNARKGDYAAVVTALIEAGAERPGNIAGIVASAAARSALLKGGALPQTEPNP